MSQYGNIGDLTLPAESRVALIQVKVIRAKKHIQDLEVAALPWKGQDTHVIVRDLQAKPGNKGQDRWVRLPELPFDILALAGDALQNLRTALDHLMFHLAIVAGVATSKQLRRIAFPIFENKQAYEAEIGGKVALLRPAAQKAIELIEPYDGGKGEILWRLHSANNWDKHCGLTATAHDALFYGEHYEGGFWFQAPNPQFGGIFPSNDKQKVEYAINPPFGEVQLTMAEPLVPSLYEMADFVEALVKRFEPFLS